MGCGNIGAVYDEVGSSDAVYTHAGLYRHSPHFELVCAADANSERLKAFGDHWGISRLYPDLSSMLSQEDLDVISIATPDETHYSLIWECLQVRPPRLIFSEKPLAADSNSARKLIQAAREREVRLVIDYVRRWDSTHQAVRDFLHRNGMGRIHSVVGYYVRGLMHNGCQMINLIRFFFGKIETVQVTGHTGLGSVVGDPSLNLRLETQGEIEVQMVALDRSGYHYSIFELDIFAEDGRLCISEGGNTFAYFNVQPHPAFSNFRHLVPQEHSWLKSSYPQAMIQAGEDLAAVAGGGMHRSLNEADEALADLLVIEAAVRSAKSGGTVEPVSYTF